MTILEPLPGTYGKADWEDYKHYWREADAEWMQDRMVLRTQNAISRDALAQSTGSLVYNEALDQVELRSKLGGYKTLTPLPTSLATSEAGGKATISHIGAGGLGISFSAAEIEITDDFKVLGGVLTVSTTGVSVKTGAKTAKLSTDAANLVSDSPVSAPGVVITSPGSLSAAGRPAQVGALSADSATVGGVLTAGSGTIGGVGHAGNKLTASAGMDVQGGSFYGDGTSAIMRTVNRTGPYVQAHNSGVIIGGSGFFDMYVQPRVMQMPIQYYYGGVGIWNIAPSFYSAGDPGAQYFPDGSIWIS